MHDSQVCGLRLTQPALREPCASGSSGQQDKAPVERAHLRQDLLAPEGPPDRSVSGPIGHESNEICPCGCYDEE